MISLMMIVTSLSLIMMWHYWRRMSQVQLLSKTNKCLEHYILGIQICSVTLPHTTGYRRASPSGLYIVAVAASSRKTSTQTVPERVITPGSLHPCEVWGWRFCLIYWILSLRQPHMLLEQKAVSVFSITTETLLKQASFRKAWAIVKIC